MPHGSTTPDGVSGSGEMPSPQATAAAQRAVAQFSDTVTSGTASPVQVGASLGQVVTDVSDSLAGWGDGIGELVEGQARESFGDSVLGQVGEGAFAVVGEGLEAVIEATTQVSGAVGSAVGAQIEVVGAVGGHAVQAVERIADGDIGGAVHDVAGAIADIAQIELHAGAAVTVGLVAARAELVEGAVAIGREAGEAVVEVGISAVESVQELFGNDHALLSGVQATMSPAGSPVAEHGGATANVQDGADLVSRLGDDLPDDGMVSRLGDDLPDDGMVSTAGDDSMGTDASETSAQASDADTGGME